jgi:hypothetical protein
MSDGWVRGPIGLDAERRVTRADCRTVLVVIPTMTAGARLADLLALLRGDHRIQTLYTVPEAPDTWHGTAEFVAAGGALTIPWHQAVNHRFDLVLAASHVGLRQVRGRILVVPHGASSLMSGKYSHGAGRGAPHSGLARETLMVQGRVIPAALGLTHNNELRALRRSCPEALPAAVVAGDICYDRMVASVPSRDSYRRSLGIPGHQKLITVSSTWLTESTFGRHPDLCRRLLAELPRSGHRVALVLHPNVWAVHGRWQVTAWLADCLQDGLLLIPPEEGWRATMVASDLVIGDHGSTTQYAAALGTPVALAAYPERTIRTGSIADRIAKVAPHMDMTRPLLPQLSSVRSIDRQIATLLTSKPGQAAPILRQTIYRLLELSEPDGQALLPPVPLPDLITS